MCRDLQEDSNHGEAIRLASSFSKVGICSIPVNQMKLESKKKKTHIFTCTKTHSVVQVVPRFIVSKTVHKFNMDKTDTACKPKNRLNCVTLCRHQDMEGTYFSRVQFSINCVLGAFIIARSPVKMELFKPVGAGYGAPCQS